MIVSRPAAGLRLARMAALVLCAMVPSVAAADITNAVIGATLRYCLDGRVSAQTAIARVEADGGTQMVWPQEALPMIKALRAFTLKNGVMVSFETIPLKTSPPSDGVACKVLGKGADPMAAIAGLSEALAVTFTETAISLAGLPDKTVSSYRGLSTDPADPMFSVSIMPGQDVLPGQHRLGNNAALGFSFTVGYIVAGSLG